MTTTVGELTPNDTGQTVTIEHGRVTISGPLREVHVNQDWIAEVHMCQDPALTTNHGRLEWPGDEYVPGRRTITLAIGGWTSPDLPPSTPVVIL